MGCFQSKTFKPDNSMIGKNEFAMEIYDKLHLTSEELFKLEKEFKSIDLKHINEITQVELFTYLYVAKTELFEYIFRAYDKDMNSTLNLCEFICLVWDFLSIDSGILCQFAYSFYDLNMKNALDYKDVTRLVEIIHNKSIEKNIVLKEIVTNIIEDFSTCSAAQFEKWSKCTITLCSPLIEFQFRLRKKVIGDIFWTPIIKRRLQIQEQNEPFYMIKTWNQVTENRRAIESKRLADQRERERYELADRMANASSTSEDKKLLRNQSLKEFYKVDGKKQVNTQQKSLQYNPDAASAILATLFDESVNVGAEEEGADAAAQKPAKAIKKKSKSSAKIAIDNSPTDSSNNAPPPSITKQKTSTKLDEVKEEVADKDGAARKSRKTIVKQPSENGIKNPINATSPRDDQQQQDKDKEKRSRRTTINKASDGATSASSANNSTPDPRKSRKTIVKEESDSTAVAEEQNPPRKSRKTIVTSRENEEKQEETKSPPPQEEHVSRKSRKTVIEKSDSYEGGGNITRRTSSKSRSTTIQVKSDSTKELPPVVLQRGMSKKITEEPK